LSDDDRIRRQTIMRLMCDLSLDYAALSKDLEIDFARYFGAELESLADLEEDGLLTRGAGGLVVNDVGRLFIRNIAMRFDRYLPAARERRFSKTI
jgi:oxygen-independent coproporphyrinogen-3 oxidase